MFAATMTEERALSACPVLGICVDRKEAQSLVQRFPLSWKEWWARVSKLKSLGQWQSKLRAFREDDEGSWIQGAKSYSNIGTKLFQHLDYEGDWNAEPLQDCPP